jgi:hypothetical protein
MGDFFELYCMILDVEQFQRHFLSSMDIFKDNFRAPKPSFPSPTTSLFFSTHLTNTDMRRQINMCLFMSMIVILIEIKFDIDINNDELLTTV